MNCIIEQSSKLENYSKIFKIIHRFMNYTIEQTRIKKSKIIQRTIIQNNCY